MRERNNVAHIPRNCEFTRLVEGSLWVCMTTSKYSYLGTYHNASANIPPEHLLLLYLEILSSMYSDQNVLAFVDLQETKSQQHFIS